MKYAAVVLFNNKNPLSHVDYLAVTDALLSGGVLLGELVLLPYDVPTELGATLTRLALDCDGVFVICDPALLSAARRQVEIVAEGEYREEYLLETERCLFGVLPTGERGAEIVRTETVPRIDLRRKNSYSRVILRTVSAPAEKLKHALAAAREVAGNSLTLHVSEKYGQARIELIYDRATPKMTADETVRILATELSDFVYALEDVSIAQQLVEVLKLRRMRLSTAESFTGGGVGREIVRIPGASEVFYEGINAYQREAKADRLGVSADTLKSKGAVSDETAYEMAAGLLRAGNCDIAIATTGCAGPAQDGGAPVGLCFIAVGTREQVNVFRFHLTGDRESITETAINLALFLAYKEVK